MTGENRSPCLRFPSRDFGAVLPPAGQNSAKIIMISDFDDFPNEVKLKIRGDGIA